MKRSKNTMRYTLMQKNIRRRFLPILWKIIGAVTHRFVQDSTKGYEIFIENMLEH